MDKQEEQQMMAMDMSIARSVGRVLRIAQSLSPRLERAPRPHIDSSTPPKSTAYENSALFLVELDGLIDVSS